MKKFLLAFTLFGTLSLGFATSSYADMDYLMGMTTGISNGTTMGTLGAMAHQTMIDNEDDDDTPSKSTPQDVNISTPSIQKNEPNSNDDVSFLSKLIFLVVVASGIYYLFRKVG